MHPRQLDILKQASAEADRLIGKEAAAGSTLWFYQDADGNEFYLAEKIVTTLRSPFTGKTFTPHPIRMTTSELSKYLRTKGKEDTSEPSKAVAPVKDTTPEPLTLEAFAAKVNAVAKEPGTAKFHKAKAFISSIKDRGFPTMDRRLFESMLIKAHQSRLIAMTRADLVGAMDPKLVANSEVQFQNATFHFVEVPGAPQW